MNWKRQGDEQWTPTHVSLPGEGENELVYIGHRAPNWFRCAVCHTRLNRVPYVLYGPVPRQDETDIRYCVEHSPVAIDVQEA